MTILKEKTAHRRAQDDLVDQLKSEDVGILVGAKLDLLVNAMMDVQLNAKVCGIEAQGIFDGGQSPELSQENKLLVMDLSAQLSHLLINIDQKLKTHNDSNLKYLS